MADSRDKFANIIAQVAYYSGLGFIMPAGLVGGYAVGWFFDRKFGTSPILTIICALMGAAGGLIEVLRIVMRAEKIDERRESNGRHRED